MALVLADRVQEYSTTTGTGTLTLSGAYAGFQTFAAAIGNGNTCYYTISSDSNQWEVGIGTVGVGTLARTTLISSSTGSFISFTGTLTVFVDYPAEKAVYRDAAGNYVPSTPTFTSITDSGLTSGRVTYAGTGGLLQDSANLTFNGTTLTTANDATVNGNNVGKGGGAVASNQSFGGFSLSKNTTGSNNTSIGYFALYQNLTGGANVGIGLSALQNNTTGGNQTAIGYQTLNSATTAVATFGSITAGSGYTDGTYTAVSMSAVSGATFNTYPTVTVVVAGGVVTTVTLVTAGIGASSTAATVLTVAAALIGGTGSGFSIPVATFVSANFNTAVGHSAGPAISTASFNTAVGYQALLSATTAASNVAIGYQALNSVTLFGGNNTVVGTSAGTNLVSGGNNLVLGASASATSSSVANEITLGNSSITAFRIPGLTITGGAKWMNFGSSTVALLAAAATAGRGARAFVTDALAPSFGVAVTGGGAVSIPVYSDGTTWLVG
jgi:hypothetical protein